MTQYPLKTPLLAIGMITCHRPGIDVHEAIPAVAARGFHELVHLFCEPGTLAIGPMPKMVVHRNAVQRGILGNWAYCLNWLVEHTSAEYVMVCEDDVLYAKGGGAPPGNAISIASNQPATGRSTRCGGMRSWREIKKAGCHETAVRDTWGTLSMCFPRSSAKRGCSNMNRSTPKSGI